MAIYATNLERRPGEDPFIVVRGGFYRRWLTMLGDLEELILIVNQLEGTTEDKWVPVWREAGQRHEAEGDRLDKVSDINAAKAEYLLAKTYFSIGRFPSEISPMKEEISKDCARVYRKACAKLDPPMEVLEIVCVRKGFRAHFRAPKTTGKP